MTEFGFGQPRSGLIQLGYVVADLDGAMASYSRLLGIPRWEVIRSFRGEDPWYLGKPSTAAAHIAMGFSGHTQIELIQPADEQPSVLRDESGAVQPGFHHFGVAAEDFDTALAALTANGDEVVFQDRPNATTRVAYVDTRATLGAMVELIEASDELDALFTAMWRRSADVP